MRPEEQAPESGWAIRMKRLALCLFVALLFVAGDDRAQTPIEAHYQIALAWWGDTPEQCTSLDLRAVPAYELQPGRVGEATIPEVGWYGPCRLWIDESLKPCEVESVMRHEVGHLLGYNHTDDPEDVMYFSSPGWWCRIEWLRKEWVEVKRELRLERRECRRDPDRWCRFAMRWLRKEQRKVVRELAEIEARAQIR